MGSFLINLYPRLSGYLLASGIDFARLNSKELIEKLNNSLDCRERAKAAEELGRRNETSAILHLRKTAENDPSFVVRYQAKRALAELAKRGSSEAAEAIVGDAPLEVYVGSLREGKVTYSIPNVYSKIKYSELIEYLGKPLSNTPFSDWRNPNDTGLVSSKAALKIFGNKDNFWKKFFRDTSADELVFKPDTTEKTFTGFYNKEQRNKFYVLWRRIQEESKWTNRFLSQPYFGGSFFYRGLARFLLNGEEGSMLDPEKEYQALDLRGSMERIGLNLAIDMRDFYFPFIAGFGGAFDFRFNFFTGDVNGRAKGKADLDAYPRLYLRNRNWLAEIGFYTKSWGEQAFGGKAAISFSLENFFSKLSVAYYKKRTNSDSGFFDIRLDGGLKFGKKHDFFFLFNGIIFHTASISATLFFQTGIGYRYLDFFYSSLYLDFSESYFSYKILMGSRPLKYFSVELFHQNFPYIKQNLFISNVVSFGALVSAGLGKEFEVFFEYRFCKAEKGMFGDINTSEHWLAAGIRWVIAGKNNPRNPISRLEYVSY